MNRKAFLTELRRELDRLPTEERENAIAYYEEFLDEAGPENEAATIQGFGAPRAIAAELRAEHVLSTPSKTPREGALRLWVVILAIFASPIAIPVAMGLFLLIGSLIFAFGITAFALLVAGMGSIVGAFGVLLADPRTFLLFLGGGAAMTGLSVLFAFLTYFITVKLLGGFANLLARILHRRKRGA